MIPLLRKEESYGEIADHLKTVLCFYGHEMKDSIPLRELMEGDTTNNMSAVATTRTAITNDGRSNNLSTNDSDYIKQTKF